MLYLNRMHVFLDGNRIDCLNKDFIFGSNLYKVRAVNRNKINCSSNMMDTTDLDVCEHSDRIIISNDFYTRSYLKVELKINISVLGGLK